MPDCPADVHVRDDRGLCRYCGGVLAAQDLDAVPVVNIEGVAVAEARNRGEVCVMEHLVEIDERDGEAPEPVELALTLVHRVEDRHRPHILAQEKRACDLDIAGVPRQPCLVARGRCAHEVYIAEILRLLGEAVLSNPVRRGDHHLDAVVVPHRVADKLHELL